MSDRYFGKVVAANDKFTIVMNKGSTHGVEVGDQFLVVGLGQSIIDPDTQEELGQLEIVRGKVSVTHVQEKIATARSCEFEKFSDIKETKKVTSRSMGALAGLMGPQDTITESIRPVAEELKELEGAQLGDLLLKL